MGRGGGHDEGNERRESKRGQYPVRSPATERPADDGEQGGACGGECRQPERQARCIVRAQVRLPASLARSPCTKPGRNGKR